MIHYPNIRIGIAMRFIKELKKENLVDLIEFIKENCNMTLNNDTYKLYKHELFFLHKTKVPNLYTFKLYSEEIEKLKQKINDNQKDTKEETFSNEDSKKEKEEKEENDEKEEKNINIKEENNDINSENKINLINNKKFYCSNHHKYFKTNGAYLSHCKVTHKFKCKYCGKMFGFLKKFNKHHIICRNNNNKNISKNLLKCNEINLTFENSEIMKSHIFESHDTEIGKNENIKKENSMIEEIKEKNQLKKKKEEYNIKKAYYYKCYLDGIKFRNEKKYTEHFEIYHPDDFPFYCYYCQMGFYSNKEYDEHFFYQKHL
jgi:hypothetical protein